MLSFSCTDLSYQSQCNAMAGYQTTELYVWRLQSKAHPRKVQGVGIKHLYYSISKVKKALHSCKRSILISEHNVCIVSKISLKHLHRQAVVSSTKTWQTIFTVLGFFQFLKQMKELLTCWFAEHFDRFLSRRMDNFSASQHLGTTIMTTMLMMRMLMMRMLMRRMMMAKAIF